MKTPSLPSIKARIEKKHPNNYRVDVKESTHCVLGHIIDIFVETEDEDLHYTTDKAYRVRLVSSQKLTPTYKSIRLQPHDSAVVIRGGKFDGQYITLIGSDGWLVTTTDISEVKAMRAAYAEENRAYISLHAQSCYRGTFEVVKVN